MIDDKINFFVDFSNPYLFILDVKLNNGVKSTFLGNAVLNGENIKFIPIYQFREIKEKCMN